MPNYVASRSYYRQYVCNRDESNQEQKQEQRQKWQQSQDAQDVIYLVPSNSYTYDHPEGTGHDNSPFFSIWYCGICRRKNETQERTIEQVVQYWKSYCSKQKGVTLPRIATSLKQLELMGAIPSLKRPNPKQRKKKKLERLHEPVTTKFATTNNPKNVSTIQKSSFMTSTSTGCDMSSSTPTASKIADSKAKSKIRTSPPPKQQQTTNLSSATSNNKKKKRQRESKYRDGDGQRVKKRF